LFTQLFQGALESPAVRIANRLSRLVSISGLKVMVYLAQHGLVMMARSAVMSSRVSFLRLGQHHLMQRLNPLTGRSLLRIHVARSVNDSSDKVTRFDLQAVAAQAPMSAPANLVKQKIFYLRRAQAHISGSAMHLHPRKRRQSATMVAQAY
jgi:hypothetical protein